MTDKSTFESGGHAERFAALSLAVARAEAAVDAAVGVLSFLKVAQEALNRACDAQMERVAVSREELAAARAALDAAVADARGREAAK